MAEPRRTDLRLRAERAVLAQVVTPDGPYDPDETLDELENLARTAGAVVLERLRQKRQRPDPKHYVGKGKLGQLRALCRMVDADVVICDDELSPAQVRALESELDVKVVDRSEVILDIFAAHARTTQARLQVELAQLEYEFPRLKRMWTHLDRTAGGTLGGPAGGGIGVRGPGERQLEVDRRLVQRRIYDLRRRLHDGARRPFPCRRAGRLHQRRQVQPDERPHRRRGGRARPPVRDAGHPHPALEAAGGTGGVAQRHGRVRAQVPPSSGRLVPRHAGGGPRGRPAAALHVVDASRPDCGQEIEAVNLALREVDCHRKPTLFVLNKIDLLEDPSELLMLRRLVGDFVCTSAVTGEGLEELQQRVARELQARHAEFRVLARAGDGRLIAFVHQNAHVLDQICDDATMALHVRMEPSLAGVIRSMGARVEEAHANPPVS